MAQKKKSSKKRNQTKSPKKNNRSTQTSTARTASTKKKIATGGVLKQSLQSGLKIVLIFTAVFGPLLLIAAIVNRKPEKSTDKTQTAIVRTTDSSQQTNENPEYNFTSPYAKSSESISFYPAEYTKDKTGLYNLTCPVIDVAKLLDQNQYGELDDFLRTLDSTTGVQIAVLTVDSLDGNSIEEFSIRHAEKWKLGQKGVDNGALLVASMEEHALRIETGYGTETVLTDAKCSRIINNILVPKFQGGKYGDGIVEAVKNMAGIITSDESLISFGELKDAEEPNIFFIALILILPTVFIIFLIILISNIFNKSNISSSSGSYHSGGSSRSSYSRSSYSGGSSFGGGGGSFGGGGASGHW